MKRIMFFIPLLLLVLLSACTPNVKSENEMKIDVQNYLNSFGEGYWAVEKVIVTERKTSKKDGTDVVNVELEATTEQAEGIYSLILNYKLYEQGWFLESATADEKGRREVRPTKEPNQDVADKIIHKKYPKATFLEKESFMEENKCVFYYENQCSNEYVKEFIKYGVVMKFNTTIIEWECEEIKEIDANYVWDILGKWHPVPNPHIATSNRYNGFVMNITKLDETGMTVKMQKNGKVYFNQTVPFDEKEGAEFSVKTGTSVGTINTIISPSRVYADVWTILGITFERK